MIFVKPNVYAEGFIFNITQDFSWASCFTCSDFSISHLHSSFILKTPLTRAPCSSPLVLQSSSPSSSPCCPDAQVRTWESSGHSSFVQPLTQSTTTTCLIFLQNRSRIPSFLTICTNSKVNLYVLLGYHNSL